MKHTASRRFWKCFDALAPEVQAVARKNFELLKRDPAHPSLQFKLLGKMHSVRAGLHHRALGLPKPGGVHWFWIGSHSDYDNIAT